MEEKLSKIISDHFIKTNKRPQRTRPLGWFHASEAGMCPRALFYKIRRPKEPDESTLRLFHLGTVLHEDIQRILANYFKDNNAGFEFERPITITDHDTELVVSGVVDGIIFGKKRTVLEFKTTKTLYYIKEKNEPQKHHVSQLMMYMRAMLADVGYVVYIDKGSYEIKAFEVKFDKDEFERLMDKFRSVYFELKENVLPKNAPEDEMDCRFCSYQEECSKKLMIRDDKT